MMGATSGNPGVMSFNPYNQTSKNYDDDMPLPQKLNTLKLANDFANDHYQTGNNET